jgi:hypothetical protein
MYKFGGSMNRLVFTTPFFELFYIKMRYYGLLIVALTTINAGTWVLADSGSVAASASSVINIITSPIASVFSKVTEAVAGSTASEEVTDQPITAWHATTPSVDTGSAKDQATGAADKLRSSLDAAIKDAITKFEQTIPKEEVKSFNEKRLAIEEKVKNNINAIVNDIFTKASDKVESATEKLGSMGSQVTQAVSSAVVGASQQASATVKTDL